MKFKTCTGGENPHCLKRAKTLKGQRIKIGAWLTMGLLQELCKTHFHIQGIKYSQICYMHAKNKSYIEIILAYRIKYSRLTTNPRGLNRDDIYLYLVPSGIIYTHHNYTFKKHIILWLYKLLVANACIFSPPSPWHGKV